MVSAVAMRLLEPAESVTDSRYFRNEWILGPIVMRTKIERVANQALKCTVNIFARCETEIAMDLLLRSFTFLGDCSLFSAT
jgi:hypothetical protein